MSSDGKVLFDRRYSLVIAPSGGGGTLGAIEAASGLDVSKLRCVFKVKKSLKPEPNTCEVKVYNLAQSSRRVLESASKLVMRLEAGYESTGTHQIYLGEVRHATTTWDGPTCETMATSGDSEKDIAQSRCHVTIGPGVPAEVALENIVRTLKNVGAGNVAEAAALLKAKGVATMFGPGTVISGNTWRMIQDFARSAGLEASILDGKIQILDLGQPLSDKAVEIGPNSGLEGSPTIDGKGIVKARVKIIPELAPGRKVSFVSKSVQGGYRIETAEWVGDTHGLDWYVEIACKKY